MGFMFMAFENPKDFLLRFFPNKTKVFLKLSMKIVIFENFFG